MLQSSLGTDHAAWRRVDLAEAVRQGMGCLRSRRQGSGRHDPALAVASWAGRSQSANSGHSTRGWDSRGHMAVTLVRAAVPLPRLVVEAAPPSTRRHLRLSDLLGIDDVIRVRYRREEGTQRDLAKGTDAHGGEVGVCSGIGADGGTRASLVGGRRGREEIRTGFSAKVTHCSERTRGLVSARCCHVGTVGDGGARRRVCPS